MSDPLKLVEATEAAVAAELASGAPAELLLAQWALESAWGDHSPGNNCFGIKIYPGCFGRQLLTTHEWFTGQELAYFMSNEPGRTATLDPTVTTPTERGRMKYVVKDWFATFPTLVACFERRAQLFGMGRYKPFAEAFKADRDLPKLIKAIGPVYATDPAYSDTLLKIIGQQNVEMALSSARGSAGPIVG